MVKINNLLGVSPSSSKMTKLAVVMLIFVSDNCSAGSSWKVALNVSVGSTMSSLVMLIVIMTRFGLIGDGSMVVFNVPSA